MSRDHSPAVTEAHTETVICAANGPETVYFDQRGANLALLADLEAFTRRLRELGATDDTPVENAVGLQVRLDMLGRSVSATGGTP